MEKFLSGLRKTREQLKDQPEEMAKVNNTGFYCSEIVALKSQKCHSSTRH